MGRRTLRGTERRLCQWGAIVLLGCFFTLALSSATVKSATMDEGGKLAMGYSYLKTFDLRFQGLHKHPRLAEAWVALPLVLDRRVPSPAEVPGWDSPRNFFGFVSDFYYCNSDIVRYTLVGRIQVILLGLVLGALVFRWASEWFGWTAGLVACFLYVFSPNILAHSRLITNDLPAALVCLSTMYMLQRLLRRPSIPRAVLLGLVLGGALLVKYSTVLLVPVLGAVLALAAWYEDWRWAMWAGLDRRKVALRTLAMAAVIFGLAGLIVWAGFGFEVRRLGSVELPFPVPAASVIDNLVRLYQVNQGGRPAFLLGQRWSGGRWYYYLATMFFKTPPPALLLFVVACVAAVRRRRLAEQLPLWLFPAAHFLVNLIVGRNTGHRYLLTVLPFGFVFISQLVPLLSDRLRVGWARAGSVVLVVWYLGASLWIYPDYLAYFNLFAGGPSRGYEVLVDSNLDWGQDLVQLRRYMEREGLDEVWLSLFSLTDPAVYGIRAHELPDWGDKEIGPGFHYLHPDPGVYVVSATLLQGLYMPNPSTFDWFIHREPVDQIGYSMLVYRVEEDAVSPTWVGMCYAPESPLSPGAIEAGFGPTGLRVVYFDCRSAWVIPEGGPPGWYVVPVSAGSSGSPSTRWLGEAILEFEQLPYEGSQAFAVYRLDAVPTAYLEPMSPVWVVREGARPNEESIPAARLSSPPDLDGPATFLGYSLGAQTIEPGTVLAVDTFWRAKRAVTETMPSVFVHLVDDSGKIWSIGDALDFPAIQWQDGDTFVQHHALELPSNAPPGSYWLESGLYDLVTGGRYPVRAAGTDADTFLFGPVMVELER
jgi:hypothetical protein